MLQLKLQLHIFFIGKIDVADQIEGDSTQKSLIAPITWLLVLRDGIFAGCFVALMTYTAYSWGI